MNYAKIYSTLINSALDRTFIMGYERHHIIPRSMGGLDELSNIVCLTPREHYLAHLLLYKMGNPNQIFSVKAFLDNSINPRSIRFGLFRWKKWIKRAVAYQAAFNIRNAQHQEAAESTQKKIDAMIKRYEAKVQEINAQYASTVTDALFEYY